MKYKWNELQYVTVAVSTQEARERVCQMRGERRGCLGGGVEAGVD